MRFAERFGEGLRGVISIFQRYIQHPDFGNGQLLSSQSQSAFADIVCHRKAGQHAEHALEMERRHMSNLRYILDAQSLCHFTLHIIQSFLHSDQPFQVCHLPLISSYHAMSDQSCYSVLINDRFFSKV
ncbi:hypothetical protein D3C75_1087500 [compost metagenome]